MDLSEHHRHFLIVKNGLVAGFVNVVINSVIAWLILRNHSQIPLWGGPSMGIDLLSTGFLLPFAMCMIVSRTIRSEVAKGKLPALEPDQIGIRGMYRHSILVRSLVLGAAGVVFTATPLVVLLDLPMHSPSRFYTSSVSRPSGLDCCLCSCRPYWPGGSCRPPRL